MPRAARSRSSGPVAAPDTVVETGSPADAAEKNRPLVEDIRLLGRILGDVIREQEGKVAYELVEKIRQLSVAALIAETIVRFAPGAGVPQRSPVPKTRRFSGE